MAIEKVKLTSESASATQSKLNDNFEYLDLNKVDVDGSKVLSDNNYDDDSKEKLDNLPIYSTTTPNTRIFYGGTCSTATLTTEKTVVLAEYDSLKKGDMVEVKFSNSEISDSVKLNVNGTGAKNVLRTENDTFGSLNNSIIIDANDVIKFVYDGTSWILFEINGINFYSKYSNQAKGISGGLSIPNGNMTIIWRGDTVLSVSDYYVDKESDQTIGGTKTFSTRPVYNNSGLATQSELADKQNITDNNLATTNKTIVSAINEVNSKAEGREKATSYASISAMVTGLNAMSATELKVGDNIFIQALDVPDLWVYSVESTSSTYTYTTDSAFVSAINTSGYVQVGYYKVSKLESDKIDLSDYVPGTRTIAGVDLQDNITVNEMKTALGVDTLETTVSGKQDKFSELSFTDSDAGWGSLTSGYYTLTIASTKVPIACFNSSGVQIMCELKYDGTNIYVKTDTKFSGKVIAI